MEDSTRSPYEVNSTARSNRKRKLQNEPQEIPLSKHVCWNQSPKSEKKSREIESDQDSAKDSNSFQCNPDSNIPTNEETKTDLEYFNLHASNEPCTLSEIGVYSLESGSLTASRPSGPESSSTNTGQLDCLHYEYGLENPALEYEGDVIEFGSEVDCSCSEYRNDGMENCTDNEIENLLYSNGMARSNYVFSSGKWSVIQDTQQEGMKPTIDKEFEQYFSVLML